MPYARTNMCRSCKYATDLSDAERSCEAYTWIPDGIWAEGADHTQPLPGDHGIQFEPAPGVTPVAVGHLMDQLAKFRGESDPMAVDSAF